MVRVLLAVLCGLLEGDATNKMAGNVGREFKQVVEKDDIF